MQARNKKCITLNLREARGQELLLELVRVADVLTENFRPGTLEKMGLAPAVLLKIQVVFSEFDGEKKVSSMPYTLSTDDRDQAAQQQPVGITPTQSDTPQ